MAQWHTFYHTSLADKKKHIKREIFFSKSKLFLVLQNVCKTLFSEFQIIIFNFKLNWLNARFYIYSCGFYLFFINKYSAIFILWLVIFYGPFVRMILSKQFYCILMNVSNKISDIYWEKSKCTFVDAAHVVFGQL